MRRAPAAESILARIAEALDEGADWWRPRPFVADPPWVERHPEVAAWCTSLSLDEVIAVERGDQLPTSAPSVLHNWHTRLARLTALAPLPTLVRTPTPTPKRTRRGERTPTLELTPTLEPTPTPTPTPTLEPTPTPTPTPTLEPTPTPTLTVSTATDRLVPARKQRQIAAFIAALPITNGATRIVDWCGGKGHLGRSLGAHLNLPVTILERESKYAAESVALARDSLVALTFEPSDALTHQPNFDRQTLAVGLHACGELGQRLLELSVDSVHTVALAPCCLHKIRTLHDGTYAPVSAAGRAANPRLDHSSLRLATAEEVVARPSLQASRRRENAWRLGLDALLRASGRTGYTPLGTQAEALKLSNFEGFVRHCAVALGLPLPTTWSPAEYEALGWRRAERARALGLVRGLFKRAIEVYCALDRAAYLEEEGLRVTLGTFAPREVTPRNILLIAQPA